MKIKIWADVVCPFCYIGLRHIEAALDETGIAATIEMRSFQLDPRPRNKAQSTAEELSDKYGISKEEAKSRVSYVSELGKQAGLNLNFDQTITANTFKAHRLIQAAKETNNTVPLEERLMRAHFTEGLDLEDDAVLRQCALDAGFSAEDTRRALHDDYYKDSVLCDLDEARALGISGVPYFVIDDIYTINGAQPIAEMVKMLESIRDNK